MKYIVVLGDGMADRPLKETGGKTCLEAANTPNLDRLAKISEVGLCKTIPDGLKPGSDVANMSVMGFDPKIYYTGRSPLEAASIGIPLTDTDLTLRCNLVTLAGVDNYADMTMKDYSAGEISTKEAKELITYLKKYIDNDIFTLYAGIAYRHCLVVKNGKVTGGLTPPHDISDKKIGQYLPQGGGLAGEYLKLMEMSYKLLKDHPVNLKRIAAGKNPANSIWLWGEGTKPRFDSFESQRGLKGGVISAVDLVRGIGLLTGMEIIDVKGATGDYKTNFKGKAETACQKLLHGGLDYVYIHMEGPDECGHHGDWANKIYSIEQIDREVVGTILNKMKDVPFVMLVCPDHPTPCTLKTHTAEPIPYLLYSSTKNLGNGAARYTEAEAAKTKTCLKEGKELIRKMTQIV